MRALFLSLALIATAASAEAQSSAPRPPPREVGAGGQQQPVENYDDTLGGLSRVLGGAHYLRILCSGRSDQSWRSQMGKLMNLEGPPGTPRRAIMAGEFNNGYREQEVQFSGCSPAATAAEAQLKQRGARLSQALAARYRP